MQKKSPVVYIITKLELGGAQKVCLSLFHNLPERETFLISGTQGILADDLKNNPHAHLLPTFTREVGLKQILQECKNFCELTKKLRALKKEYANLIVHTHSTKAGIIGRWAAFFARITHRVHTVHGFAFHDHQNKIVWLAIYGIELFTSLITTHFVCVSSADITLGKKLFPRFSKKHSLIRAAVAWETFFIPATQATPFPTQAPFIFGTIACFKPQKNLFDLLQAFAKTHAANPQVRLEIIGDGELRPAIEAWIANHKLNNIITLHGWQQTVVPYMLNWHAFVLSSLWEGLPCAIIEARLLHLPVISYNTGGITDVIHHAKNGFIIPQKNWPALADAMLALSQDKTGYTAMQQYPDELGPFHHEAMLKEHAALYQNLENNKLK